MNITSLKQLAQEIGYLQALLGAIQTKSINFFSPVQAARVVQQLTGMQNLALAGNDSDINNYAIEIEALLEQAYEVIGTIEITA